MTENNLYYIYIDSSIEGTIDQLLSYFETHVFHPDDCICVYFKFYKDIEKYIHQKLKTTQIRYKFIRKNSDFIFIKNKVVFYLFNAQSNCRVVARRDLTHVFVTHGESHKLASIKPIIRIYDFVISSGQVGIDRFLKAGIFNLSNIQDEQRVIPMGNTFIGQADYQFDSSAEALLYAPTWEGGVPNENYSSLSMKTGTYLSQIIKNIQISTLYIQVHPNLGHRDKKYIHYLKKTIQQLRKLKLSIVLIKSNIQFRDYFIFQGCEIRSRDAEQKYKIQAALVDISAMEMQCISASIPTFVLYEAKQLEELIIPSRVKHLYSEDKAVEYRNFSRLDLSLRAVEIAQHADYLLSYQESKLESMTFRQRIHWLCHHVMQKKSGLQQYLDVC